MSRDLRMPEINHVEIAGNLTRDPIVHDTSAGSVVEFTVAATRRRKGVETTMFVAVVAWRDLGIYCATNLHKGDPVYIEGSLSQDAWDDKDTGKKRTKTKVTAWRAQSLSWPMDGPTTGIAKPEALESPQDEPLGEDDIPF